MHGAPAALVALKARFGPTLARRVLVAMLIVYGTVWLALIGVQYLMYMSGRTQARERQMASDGRVLDRFATEGEAAAFLTGQAGSANSNPLLPPRFFELRRIADQRVVFNASPPFPVHLPDRATPHQTMRTMVINGHEYQVFRRDGPRWSLRVAVPVMTLPDFAVVRGASLNVQMALCAPIFLLSIWFAISRGLLPLRQLSRHLAEREARNPHDLALLQFEPQYAELKPLVAALNALLLRLKQKIEHEHAFVQDAAHELRTPMAVISAEVHVLATAANALAQAQSGQRITHAQARASHLIGQLLELARVDDPRWHRHEVQDVAGLARLGLDQLVGAAAKRQVSLSLNSAPCLLHALEKNTFQSILHNLLDNAIRYGRVGGRVEVDLQVQGTSLLLVVTDDGPGIAKAERESVFERFYRCAGMQASGSGLGLSIVQQAANRLGASVTLSEGWQGAGCRFAVLIPLNAGRDTGG